MQSEASSSSPKRSASECPSYDSGARSPPSDDVSTISNANLDQDIDAYMAEQDNSDSPALALATRPARNGIVPPSDKFSIVQDLLSVPMQVGQTWYLVSKLWYRRWQKACTGEVDKEGAVNEADLGPVNNSSLVDEEGNLLTTLQEGVDVEYVPEEVWHHFTTW
jgi:ubiquitin carboxyl-terminal hydrolase 4/11/15